MWPTLIVLDTNKSMKALRHFVSRSGKPHDLADDLVDDIVHRIRHRQRAQMRLDELSLSIMLNDYEELEDTGGHVDKAILPFVDDLARVITEQVALHCLYDEDGFLPYTFKRPKELEFNDVILKRIDREQFKKPEHYQYTSRTYSF
jgi:hypothetical protein